jgi:crotonobetainyl-CoA:carnitine CoA-transferase CaiB-like acyl-CoA transferase
MSSALNGVRVLDLTHDWAGPHATRLLADCGADVIKIEYARRLDGMRGGYLQDGRYNRHPRFWQLHRNKRSITLDLTCAEHRARALVLVRWADVVVDSSRPGVLDRLGLGWDIMRAERPDLILVQMSAFGATGPDASYGGYGGAIEPLSGVQALTGYDETGPPRRIRELDVTNGIAGACAVLTALLRRQATGQGALIDLSQTEAAISTMAGDRFLEVAAGTGTARAIGNRHRTFAPHGCYPSLGDDRWVVISVQTDGEWQALCQQIGRPELASDPRFSDAVGRRTHHDLIDGAITAWTRQRTHREAMDALQAAGVRAGAVFDAADIAADPHLAARGWMLDAQDGSGRYPGAPFRLARDPIAVGRRGPFLGEHNAEVGTGILGMTPGEVEDLHPSELGTAFDPE